MKTKTYKQASQLLPPSPGPAPWLVFPSGKDRDNHTLFNVSDPEKNNYNFLKFKGKKCLASMHGWLVMMDRNKARFFLWNLHSKNRIDLPSWNPEDFDICLQCFLTSPPTDLDCMVLCVGEEFLLFWRQGDKKWTKQNYKIQNKGVSVNYINRLITSSNGTIYASTFQSNLVTIKRRGCGCTLSIRLLDVEKPTSFPKAFCCSDYIVESCGELYYVLLHFLPVSDQEISRVEVFKLNFSRKVWVKVDCIGDTVLFLSAYSASISFSVTNTEMKGNQIYFTIRGDNKTLYVYDLEDESLCPHFPCPNLQSPSFPPFWLMHSNGLAESHRGNAKTTIEDLNMEKSTNMVAAIKKNVEDSKWPDWTDLPMDVLRLSTNHITFGTDYKNFRSVCKTWAASVPRHRWPINQIGSTTECPWLMFSNREKIKCSFLDPVSSFIHCNDIPELLGAKICFSKAGWLLMSRGDRSIFFLNPFNYVIIKLPDLPRSFRFSGLSFSSSPTSPDCIVFGAVTNSYNEVDICYLHIRENTWVWRCFDNNVRMILSDNNPVFCDGAFYCLSHQRHLGILDLKDGRCDWTNLSIPEPFSSIDRNYLVECNGEMLSVSVGNLGKWVKVYKLDRSNMNWTLLNSLEDRALFVSVTTSVSLIDPRMKNKIYFPLSYKDKNNYVFYSLETRRWQSSFGDYCREDIYNTREQLHCTWIQPILSWKTDNHDS